MSQVCKTVARTVAINMIRIWLVHLECCLGDYHARAQDHIQTEICWDNESFQVTKVIFWLFQCESISLFIMKNSPLRK